MLKKNVKYGSSIIPSGWRKISVNAWKPVGDSQVRTEMSLPIDKVEAYLKARNSDTKLTLTHFVGKAFGYIYKKHPYTNAVIRFGKIHQRKNVDIFYQVIGSELDALSGHVIRDIDTKSIEQISIELIDYAKKIKSGNDQIFNTIKKSIGFVPRFLTPFVLRLLSFLQYDLNIWSPMFGMPQDGFGGMMITNIGSLGVDHGYVPLPTFTRTPFIVAVGRAQKKPVVDENDEIVIKKMCTFCVTFDHRLIDGAHGAVFVHELRKIFENPEIVD